MNLSLAILLPPIRQATLCKMRNFFCRYGQIVELAGN
jgi:hypothetical protein